MPIQNATSLNFETAVSLLAAPQAQWCKLSGQDKIHFYGNWSGRSLLEFAVKYLCIYEDWTDRRITESSASDRAYDVMRGLIAAISCYPGRSISEFCLSYCTNGKTSTVGSEDILLKPLAAAARLHCKNAAWNLDFTETVQAIISDKYFVIQKEELEKIQKSAKPPQHINRSWLTTLLSFGTDTENKLPVPAGSHLLAITPTQAYLSAYELTLRELAILRPEQILSIFIEWQEPEAAYHIKMCRVIQSKIWQWAKFDCYLNEDDLLENGKQLVDFFQYHLAKGKTQPEPISSSNLYEALGIVCCAVNYDAEELTEFGFRKGHLVPLTNSTSTQINLT